MDKKDPIKEVDRQNRKSYFIMFCYFAGGVIALTFLGRIFGATLGSLLFIGLIVLIAFINKNT